MKVVLGFCIGLGGCAFGTPSTVEQPIQQVRVNCAKAGQISNEMMRVIENPNVSVLEWESSFAALSGHQTAPQRVSSAKTILWSIRTNCRGY